MLDRFRLDTLTCAGLLTLLIVATPVHAGETVMPKESRRAGDKLALDLVNESNDQYTQKTKDGTVTKTDAVTREHIKGTLTILEAKDGSATQSRIDVDPGCRDAHKVAGAAEETRPSPFAGKTITLTRHEDGTIDTDLKNNAADLGALTSVVDPDQDLFADHPVAVGDTWDVSQSERKTQGIGPKDKIIAKCRLDDVKVVDGRKMAEISCSMASIVTQEDKTELETELSFKFLIDAAQGLIVKLDGSGRTRYTSPKDEPVQMNGSTDLKFHATSRLIETNQGSDRLGRAMMARGSHSNASLERSRGAC